MITVFTDKEQKMNDRNQSFETKNYVKWDDYLKEHDHLSDIERASDIQKYEDLVFALVLRLFR